MCANLRRYTSCNWLLFIQFIFVAVPGRGIAHPHFSYNAGTITADINAAFDLDAHQVDVIAAGDITTNPPPGETIVTVVFDGKTYKLHLTAHSLRSPDYQLIVQQAAGTYSAITPGPEKTYRGYLEEVGAGNISGSFVAATILASNKVHARIAFPAASPHNGKNYWIEPLTSRFGGVPSGHTDDHVIYNAGDIKNRDHVSSPVTIPSALPCIFEVAIETDAEYYQTYKTGTDVNVNSRAVEDQVSMIINFANVPYENQVGIRHRLTAVVVRGVEWNQDPYQHHHLNARKDRAAQIWEPGQPFSSPFLLHPKINPFRPEASEPRPIRRSIVQFISGLDQGGGQAFQGAVCEANTASGTGYSIIGVEHDFNAELRILNLAGKTQTSAHELGHLWSAVHRSTPTIMAAARGYMDFDASDVTAINQYKGQILDTCPCANTTTVRIMAVDPIATKSPGVTYPGNKARFLVTADPPPSQAITVSFTKSFTPGSAPTHTLTTSGGAAVGTSLTIGTSGRETLDLEVTGGTINQTMTATINYTTGATYVIDNAYQSANASIVVGNHIDLVYQAEDATVSGAIKRTSGTLKPAYNGTGYVEYQASGNYTEWTLANVPAGRMYYLEFRYSDNGAANRQFQIQVNGTTVISSVVFPATGAPPSWSTVKVLVDLTNVATPAANKVRLTATAANAGFLVDQLRVTRKDLLVGGDTDGDQDVDSADTNTMFANFTGSLPPGTGGKIWAQGDFDWDGDIDTADNNILIVNWTGAQSGPDATTRIIPRVQVAVRDLFASESNDTALFQLVADPPPNQPVDVTLSTSGSAQSGSDYQAVASTVQLGTSGVATVTVTPINDTSQEGNETVTLQVVGPSDRYDLGGVTSNSLHIVDNDSLVVVQIEDEPAAGLVFSCYERDFLAWPGGYLVYANRVPASAVGVVVELTGTAHASGAQQDYTVTGQGVTITQLGSQSVTLTAQIVPPYPDVQVILNIVNDELTEPQEQVDANVKSDPAYARGNVTSAPNYVFDND